VVITGENDYRRLAVPTYDYRCEFNGQVIEVKHRMNERASTWGELCAIAGIESGSTPLDTRVEKLITGGQVVRSGSLGENPSPPCATGPCCGGGMCGIG
jgi:hypothetical protein